MNWIFGANQISEDPIIELIGMRSETPTVPSDLQEMFQNDPLFQEIPIFNKKTIKIISDRLNSHEKLGKIIHDLDFRLEFSPEKEQIFKTSFRKRKNATESSVVALFFYCLSWIGEDNATRSNLNPEFFIKCLKN